MQQGFITVKRASEILEVTPHYVRKLIKDGKITGQQIKDSNRWQVDRASLEQYRKTDVFKQDISELAKPQPITIKEAVENVEESFNGDVITYIMNPNQGSIIEPNDALHLNNLLATMTSRQKGAGKKFKKIIIVLNSGGGILEAAIKMVKIVETYANEFEVIVPLMAKSAATIIALKAHTLYLTPVSELGPVDPVVQSPTNPSIRVPAQAIEQFISQYGSQLKNTDKTPLDEILISKLNITIDPYLLGAYNAAREFSASELLECLKKYDLNEEKLAKAKEIFLRKKSHSYPILFSDLQELGIGELIDEGVKISSINTLMSAFDNFMASHNIIKVIGNRDQNNNTVLPPELIRQKSVQTGN